MDSRSLAFVQSRYLVLREKERGMRGGSRCEMPRACRRWRVRWVRRERRRRVKLNVPSSS